MWQPDCKVRLNVRYVGLFHFCTFVRKNTWLHFIILHEIHNQKFCQFCFKLQVKSQNEKKRKFLPVSPESCLCVEVCSWRCSSCCCSCSVSVVKYPKSSKTTVCIQLPRVGLQSFAFYWVGPLLETVCHLHLHVSKHVQVEVENVSVHAVLLTITTQRKCSDLLAYLLIN